MEMEEGHNQPKIAPKRIKFQEQEEDRISALPNCLLVEILSRLPSTREAIKTGILTKRWKHIWTLLPTLVFQFDNPYPNYLDSTWSDLFLFVDKTLTQRPQSKLKKFQVNISYDSIYESHVNNWIRYATTCNVEELNLTFWSISIGDGFSLDQSFYINTCFTNLTLSGCRFNQIRPISWENLTSLCISYGSLNEDLIENILSGSPQLETLVLEYFCGCTLLDITSKSVKNLVLDHSYGCRPLDIVEIKAPNILSLTIKGLVFMWNLLLVNVSSLVEANLDYTRTKTESQEEEAEEEMLKGFILSLRHVKELKIGASCLKVLSRLEAKSFVFPPNMTFPDAFYEGAEFGDA